MNNKSKTKYSDVYLFTFKLSNNFDFGTTERKTQKNVEKICTKILEYFSIHDHETSRNINLNL